MSMYNCTLPLLAGKGHYHCPEGEACHNLTLNSSHIDLEDICLSEEDYLEKYLGPQRSTVFLPVCLIYLLIFLIGVVGNVLTCTVIVRNKVMWTPTNYYLFSLAVSDLLVLLLGMPLELYELWQNYPFLLGKGGCYFKTFLFETVCLASILNVTALSVERYIAVVHPLRAKYVVTRTHAKRVILTVWGVSILCAIPNTSLHGVTTLHRPMINPDGNGFVAVEIPDTAICTLVKPRWIYNLTIQITTLLFFCLPMLTISALYLLIGLQLKREKLRQTLESKSGFGQDSFCNVRTQQQKARRQQVTKMLFVLVVVFGICWAPLSHRPPHVELHQQLDRQPFRNFPIRSCHLRGVLLSELCCQPHSLQPDVNSLQRNVQGGHVSPASSHDTQETLARVTRVTVRSTLSDVPLSNGAAIVEVEDGEVRGKDETSFSF
ncbi:hypothetical protein NQD34_002623 [Periophthalmus magnuspinnatus]|nr:hypothetical protein NQD34_002623 [Periophthalmus magnuspinnatus]